MKGIVKDLLTCNMKSDGVGQRLTGAEVAGIARVRAAGDDYTQAVAPGITVSSGPEFDVYVAGSVVQGARTLGTNTDVAVADVGGSSVGSNVAQDQKEIGVFQAGVEEQLRRHGADHFEAGGQRFSSE